MDPYWPFEKEDKAGSKSRWYEGHMLTYVYLMSGSNVYNIFRS